MRPIAAFVLGMAAIWAGSVVEASPIPTRPVHTNKTRFRIPYRFDAAELQKLGAREIRLYVSTDRGERWQHQQTVSPEAGRFDFEASADGEYWFAVRTVDGASRLHPSGKVIEPELRVIVDTTPPRLDVQLREPEPGKVQLTWRAEDLHLNPRELRLEYMQTGESGWQKVSVISQPSGQTAWSVPQGGFVAVRGSVSDLASNMVNAQAQISVSPAEAGAPRLPVPELRQPIAGSDPRGELASAATPRYPDAPDRPAAPAGKSAGDGPVLAAIAPAGVEKPGAGPVLNAVSDIPADRPESLQGRWPTKPQAEAERVPPSGRTRVVNSRKFQINYKVDDVGPSGVSRVELFISEDEGRKWFKYGDDPDRQSPFDIEVPRDGTYGFALRVHSGAGLAADPPHAGEKPEIVVVVDQTPPVVELLPVQQGRGAELNKVQIRWKVSDEHLHDQPIALSYASDRHGPWEPVCNWQEDSGSYLWTVSPGLPPRLYIRLTVRDAAGNIARAETAEPIVVDLSKPSARIVDVESLNPSGVRR